VELREWCLKSERMDHIEGRVSTCTVPTRDSKGFTSLIYLTLDSGSTFQLQLATSTLEDHIWPTHPGQRLRATDVVFDEPTSFPLEGRTTNAHLVDEFEQPPPLYINLPTTRITSFHRDESGALRLSLKDEPQEVCLDQERAKQLLNAGIGGQIQLYNVKVRISLHNQRQVIYITNNSGIRLLPPVPQPPEGVLPPPSSPPLSPPPHLFGLDEKPQRWNCMVCGYLNYPTRSRRCWKCSSTRKEGPMFKDLRHYEFEKREPYVFKRLPQWMCLKCRHRDNFYFHEFCVKCRAIRVEKVTVKRKKRKKRKENE
jgi:hypothetical protein